MTTTTLTLPAIFPADLRYNAGGDDAGWLHPHVGYDGPDMLAWRFLGNVFLAAQRLGIPWVTGTWFITRSYAATTAGEWHSDSGEGVRFVAACGARGCAQEFRDLKAADGQLVAYTKDVHRRPATGPGMRAFMSATLYDVGQTPDLSCHRLARLR